MRILNTVKKMLFTGSLGLVLMTLLLAGSAVAQSPQTQNAARKSWPAYWTKFSAAVKTKNRRMLMALTSRRFFSPGGETIGELLKQRQIWRLLKDSVETGTKPHSCRKLVCRITRSEVVEASLVFVFENNRWGFIGQLGE